MQLIEAYGTVADGREPPRTGSNGGRTWVIDGVQVRLSLRELFTAAGGRHDDWDEYHRAMAEQPRVVVAVEPTRVHGDDFGPR